MTRAKSLFIIMTIAVIAALCPAGAAAEENYTPEEFAAIERVKNECLRANALTSDEVGRRNWGVTSGAGFDGREPDDLVYNDSGVAGIYVYYEAAEWVVLGNEIFRLNEYSGTFTPQVPLYFREYEHVDRIEIDSEGRRRLENPVYVTCSFPLYLYSTRPWFVGGRWLRACGVVPGGTALPVISWVCEIDETESPELWILTTHDGITGWFLASGNEYSSYLEDYGGDLFRMTVAVDELRVEYRDSGEHEATGTEWLKRGEELRLIQPESNMQSWNFYRTEFDRDEDYIFAYGVRDGKNCRFVMRDKSDKAYDYARGENLEKMDWFVDLHPRLLDLNEYYYEPRYK